MSDNRWRKVQVHGTVGQVIADTDAAFRAVETRDSRFDGQFFTAVRSTRIYCRPGCPARTPLRRNVEFYPTSAAAQAAGFRACKRCLPEATPGSPQWNLRADTVGAAMRLIGDGVVDREGVDGLARRLGYTSRHLSRLLAAEVGASPIALARARRAHTARYLLTSSTLPISDVAFAAGFSSIRQFNETIREVFAADPSTLRRAGHPLVGPVGTIHLRLPVRAPFAASALLEFLAARAISGVEAVVGRTYVRTLLLPHGSGVVRLTFPEDQPEHPTDHDVNPRVEATLRLSDLADLTPAVERCRRLIDADADPVGIDAAVAADPALAKSVHDLPGLRLPGAVDGSEMVVRALAGQQVSVAAARTALGRMAERADQRVPIDDADVQLLFPSPDAIVGLGERAMGGPRARVRALLSAAGSLADGELTVDTGRRSADLQADLLRCNGIGPWTAGYVAMRVLGDPDVLLVTDLAIRQGAAALGLPDSESEFMSYGKRWAPFRSYAGLHLWRAAARRTRTENR